MNIYSLLVLALLTLTLNISGCGGGSGSGNGSVSTSQTTVQGVAAAGNPVSGTVYLCDSSSTIKVVSAKTTAAGEFSIDTTGLKAPFLLKSEDSSGSKLFSYANAPGTVNLNPLTTIAVAVAAGALDSNSLTTLYNNYSDPNGPSSEVFKQMQEISSHISTASSNITKSLQSLLTIYGAGAADPLSGPYIVNHQGLDGLFDKVVISITSGTVLITRKDTNAPVFSADLSELKASSLPNNIIAGNIPEPAQYGMPGNAVLMLKVQGTLPQGKLIKHASFSIQLPLGVTVVTTPLIESGPAVINTTIPFGTAAGSNSSATLSAGSGILTVTMSSLSGFSTGDILKIRYLDSSTYYMHNRTSADFTVSGTKLYSDLYSSQALPDLTIVPDDISFP